ALPSAACADGNTLCLSYFNDDRLAGQTGRTGGTISTTYDPAGHLGATSDSTGTAATGIGSTISATWYLDDLPRTVADGSRTNASSHDGPGQRVGRRDASGSQPLAPTYGYHDRELTSQTATD